MRIGIPALAKITKGEKDNFLSKTGCTTRQVRNFVGGRMNQLTQLIMRIDIEREKGEIQPHVETYLDAARIAFKDERETCRSILEVFEMDHADMNPPITMAHVRRVLAGL